MDFKVTSNGELLSAYSASKQNVFWEIRMSLKTGLIKVVRVLPQKGKRATALEVPADTSVKKMVAELAENLAKVKNGSAIAEALKYSLKYAKKAYEEEDDARPTRENFGGALYGENGEKPAKPRKSDKSEKSEKSDKKRDSKKSDKSEKTRKSDKKGEKKSALELDLDDLDLDSGESEEEEAPRKSGKSNKSGKNDKKGRKPAVVVEDDEEDESEDSEEESDGLPSNFLDENVGGEDDEEDESEDSEEEDSEDDEEEDSDSGRSYKFVLDKSTKNFRRFVAPEDCGIRGAIYVSPKFKGDTLRVRIG